MPAIDHPKPWLTVAALTPWHAKRRAEKLCESKGLAKGDRRVLDILISQTETHDWGGGVKPVIYFSWRAIASHTKESAETIKERVARLGKAGLILRAGRQHLDLSPCRPKL